MRTLIVTQFIVFLLFLAGFGFNANAAEPHIVGVAISKSTRTLSLIDSHHKVFKSYKVALGSEPVGRKEQSGDGKTPEGRYVINSKNPQSRFHLSLGISYPNSFDRKLAKARGVDPGGDIMIHGLNNEFAWAGSAQSLVDWTQGCIAVSNEEIEEIYSLVDEGTVVYIWP